MLEVIDRGEGILHDFGDVGLHLGRGRTGIRGHDRYIRRIHLREHVHGQLHEAVNTNNDNCNEDKGSCYGFFYSGFVNCHKIIYNLIIYNLFIYCVIESFSQLCRKWPNSQMVHKW